MVPPHFVLQITIQSQFQVRLATMKQGVASANTINYNRKSTLGSGA